MCTARTQLLESPALTFKGSVSRKMYSGVKGQIGAMQYGMQASWKYLDHQHQCLPQTTVAGAAAVTLILVDICKYLCVFTFFYI